MFFSKSFILNVWLRSEYASGTVIVAKHCILNIWQGLEYASDCIEFDNS